jgi:hypothetical protein
MAELKTELKNEAIPKTGNNDTKQKWVSAANPPIIQLT